MAENTPSTPAPDDSKKSHRDNSLQDTKQANEIAYTERLLGTIQTNAALKAVLVKLGYDDKELKAGSALQAAAFKKYTERQTQLAIANQNMEARSRLAASVEAEFSSYRQTVQTLYKGATRTTLGASGQTPKDTEVFTTNAGTAYIAAQKEPYASKLATRGFSSERITAASNALVEFTTANTKSKASHKAAVAATKVRNTAVKAMNDWVVELKGVAKANLKQNPGLLALPQE